MILSTKTNHFLPIASCNLPLPFFLLLIFTSTFLIYGYFSLFLEYRPTRLGGKSISGMTYLVSSEMLNLNLVSHLTQWAVTN